MSQGVQRWKPFSDDPWVATCEYSFGPGMAVSLAVALGEGLLVASPPCRVADSVFEEIAARGRVRALVATNAFHTLGLAAWKRRFPDAQVFAPAQSVARVMKQSGVAGIRPLGEAAPLLGDRVTLIDLPHYKTGEVLVKVRLGGGLAWYVTDLIMNLPALPTHPVFALLFRLSGSAPGLKLNRIAPLFMVKDKMALRRWLRDDAQREPPRWLIPAHGDVIDLGPTPDRLRELLR